MAAFRAWEEQEAARQRQVEAGKHGQNGAQHGEKGGRGKKNTNPLMAKTPEGGFGSESAEKQTAKIEGPAG